MLRYNTDSSPSLWHGCSWHWMAVIRPGLTLTPWFSGPRPDWLKDYFSLQRADGSPWTLSPGPGANSYGNSISLQTDFFLIIRETLATVMLRNRVLWDEIYDLLKCSWFIMLICYRKWFSDTYGHSDVLFLYGLSWYWIRFCCYSKTFACPFRYRLHLLNPASHHHTRNASQACSLCPRSPVLFQLLHLCTVF